MDTTNDLFLIAHYARCVVQGHMFGTNPKEPPSDMCVWCKEPRKPHETFYGVGLVEAAE